MATTSGSGKLSIDVELNICLEDNNNLTSEKAREIIDSLDFKDVTITKESTSNEEYNIELTIYAIYSWYHSDAYFSKSFGNWLPPEDDFNCDIDEDIVRNAIYEAFKDYDIDLYVSEASYDDGKDY